MSKWKETSEGYVQEEGGGKGNADYFSRPIPPARESITGLPMKNGRPDWQSVFERINEEDGIEKKGN